MIVSFADRGTEDIFDGTNSKAARRTLLSNLHDRAGRTSTSSMLRYRSNPSPSGSAPREAQRRPSRSTLDPNQRPVPCLFPVDELGAEDVEIVDYH